MPDPRAQRAAEIQEAIRRVLYDDWNPIGVDSLPPDEYDAYIAPIYRLLTETRTELDLLQALRRIERNILGESTTPVGRLRELAAKLLALDVRLG